MVFIEVSSPESKGIIPKQPYIVLPRSGCRPGKPGNDVGENGGERCVFKISALTCQQASLQCVKNKFGLVVANRIRDYNSSVTFKTFRLYYGLRQFMDDKLCYGLCGRHQGFRHPASPGAAPSSVGVVVGLQRLAGAANF